MSERAILKLTRPESAWVLVDEYIFVPACAVRADVRYLVRRYRAVPGTARGPWPEQALVRQTCDGFVEVIEPLDQPAGRFREVVDRVSMI